MYSLNDLTNEISQILSEMESESRWHPDWITQKVINLHPDIEGKDKDFYTITSRTMIRGQVRKHLDRFKLKAETEPDQQLLLPGFTRLQRRYLVAIDGTQVAVRIEDMTREQRRAKSVELRRMGLGCFQHADELDRYDDMTSKKSAA